MKLQIKFVDVGDYRFLAICDEFGKALPDQTKLTVVQTGDGLLASVDFKINRCRWLVEDGW